jgi:ATP-dependent DNA helicase RecG
VLDLSAPVQYAKGVGPQRAAALSEEGVRTLEDLLLRLPMRYEDRARLLSIADLQPGQRTGVAGVVAVSGLRRARRMTLFEARLDDGTGRLKALWFNQPYLKDVLERGAHVVLFGEVERDARGGRGLMMTSPEYEVLDAEDAPGPGLHTGRIVPIYAKLGPLQGKSLRRTMLTLAEQVPAELWDPLPAALRERLGLPTRGEALRAAHAPTPESDLQQLNAFRTPAQRRLILEELFLFQLGLALRQRALREQRKDVRFEIGDRTRDAVKRVLPFPLTPAQKRVLREIADDMRSPHPMNRLLQGDVGSGKTVVALLAMLIAIDNGYQAAFMAPTEILAEQHFLTFRRLLRKLPYAVELVSAASKGQARQAALQRLASGDSPLAVGTHALIQQNVRFARLGLAVVDEQHRFGVMQRGDLIRKGYAADVLVMTATPIPRTLAHSAYGDLDTSILDARPPGRTPVRTLLRASAQRAELVAMVRGELRAGRQAYVVYPLVEESEKLEDVRAATEMAAEWREALPEARVALLHGRLKSDEKERVMAAFAAGETQLLVATTVIEVGVDVANATLMLIEHAERFGLAQLHQLRGRVGRGKHPSSCVLVAHGRPSADARARLGVMTETDDGFLIAEKDLELRGPGDFFGTRQWGIPSFRVADLVRDRELVELARAEARREVEQGDPAALHELLRRTGWRERLELARVG